MRVAYVIHGCISVARGRMPEATMDVGEGREQDAEASFLGTSYGGANCRGISDSASTINPPQPPFFKGGSISWITPLFSKGEY